MIRPWDDEVLFHDEAMMLWSTLFQEELRSMPQLDLESLSRDVPDCDSAKRELAWREALE